MLVKRFCKLPKFMTFTKEEAAKPKEPRKDGQPCAGGCGRTTSSQWRGPGSQWCNENCKDKAKAARAALTANKENNKQNDSQNDSLAERMELLEADEEATHKKVKKMAEEH